MAVREGEGLDYLALECSWECVRSGIAEKRQYGCERQEARGNQRDSYGNAARNLAMGEERTELVRSLEILTGLEGVESHELFHEAIELLHILYRLGGELPTVVGQDLSGFLSKNGDELRFCGKRVEASRNVSTFA